MWDSTGCGYAAGFDLISVIGVQFFRYFRVFCIFLSLWLVFREIDVC